MTKRILLIILVLLVFALPLVAQEPTMQPTITPIPLPNDEIYSSLQDADEELASVDGSLSAPGGLPLLPNVSFTQLFGFAKWLISPTAGETLFGPFAPIISHLGIYLGVRFALALIYSVVFVVTYIIRWVVWLFKLILQFITAIANIINVVTDFAGGIIGKILRFI